MSDSSERTLKQQIRNFIFSLVIVGILGFCLFRYISRHYDSSTYDLFEPKVDLPIDEFKSKEVWMDRMEARVDLLEQEKKSYQDTLLHYSEREKLNEKENREKEKMNEKEKSELKKQLEQLKRKIEEAVEKTQEEELKQLPKLFESQGTLAENHLENTVTVEKTKNHQIFQNAGDFNSQFSPSPNDLFSSHLQTYQEEPIEIVPKLKPPLCEFTMPHEEKNGLFSVDYRTPANVSVKALLISSVDAVCRIDAQSDPIPVKLRLLDDGYLPNGITVKLKGCLIGASAYGDISSERVYMRLENLTNVYANGKAIETQVTGYVSGEDGRFGMRGVVVDRSAKILKPALGSGILSGIAQTLQSACSRSSKDKINSYTIGSDFAHNSASGTSDAFTMLAHYYIKRAEQVQPVLQINAGRIVDVTFTQGFSMGDMHAKADLKKIREQSRQQ